MKKTVVDISTGEVQRISLSDSEVAIRKDEEEKWELGALDRQWDAIRTQRIPLLIEADIAVNKGQDTGNSEYEFAARQYREDLRNITEQKDPFNIVWPVLNELE